MKTNFSPQNEEPINGQRSEKEIQESIQLNHHEVNVTDGRELLDDAIRTKDQPLGETIEIKINNPSVRIDYRHLF